MFALEEINDWKIIRLPLGCKFGLFLKGVLLSVSFTKVWYFSSGFQLFNFRRKCFYLVCVAPVLFWHHQVCAYQTRTRQWHGSIQEPRCKSCGSSLTSTRISKLSASLNDLNYLVSLCHASCVIFLNGIVVQIWVFAKAIVNIGSNHVLPINCCRKFPPKLGW